MAPSPLQLQGVDPSLPNTQDSYPLGSGPQTTTTSTPLDPSPHRTTCAPGVLGRTLGPGPRSESRTGAGDCSRVRHPRPSGDSRVRRQVPQRRRREGQGVPSRGHDGPSRPPPSRPRPSVPAIFPSLFGPASRSRHRYTAPASAPHPPARRRQPRPRLRPRCRRTAPPVRWGQGGGWGADRRVSQVRETQEVVKDLLSAVPRALEVEVALVGESGTSFPPPSPVVRPGREGGGRGRSDRAPPF